VAVARERRAQPDRASVVRGTRREESGLTALGDAGERLDARLGPVTPGAAALLTPMNDHVGLVALTAPLSETRQ
jgi:hypothetical protein